MMDISMNAQVRVIVGSGRGATAAPRLLVLTVATALTAFLSQAGGVFPAQFSAVTNFPVGGAPGAMVVADFNHDGRPDVAVTRAGAITLLPGLGNGAFGAPTNASSTGAQWLAEGDFNNDGNMDLLAAAHVGSVLLGDGQGSFPVRTNYTGFYASYVSDVMGGDFSGDGNLDLAIANTAMNSVHWHPIRGKIRGWSCGFPKELSSPRQVDFKNFSSFSTAGKVASAACARLSHSFRQSRGRTLVLAVPDNGSYPRLSHSVLRG